MFTVLAAKMNKGVVIGYIWLSFFKELLAMRDFADSNEIGPC